MSTVYVLPNLLSENTATISIEALEQMKELRVFAVENIKMARRSLRAMGIKTDFNDCRFYGIHHKKDVADSPHILQNILQELNDGNDVGVLSDAGMAGIADPGAAVISMAQANNIPVKPLVGPSSILLALCASGFSGQKFQFHGYLPIEKRHRAVMIQELEQEVIRSKTTQIFIETPYRNMQMFEALKNALKPETLLCIAVNITGNDEMIRTKTISSWRKSKIDLHKRPAVFLIGC